MAETILPEKKKCRNRTPKQRREARSRARLNPYQTCARCNTQFLKDEGYGKYCSLHCLAIARSRFRHFRTCLECYSDYPVNEASYLTVTRYICESCRARMTAWLAKAASLRRAEALARATPEWTDLEAIRNIYEQCKLKSQATGIPHQVDHIVPLQSDVVCGLHVSANLRIIPAEENLKKHNKFVVCLESEIATPN